MGTTSATASPANVRPVAMPFVDRLASALVTGVPPIMVAVGMWFGWMGNLLNWQDLLILAVCYFGIGTGVTVGFHRLLTHQSFRCHSFTRATFAARRIRGRRGTRDRLGGHASQAPPVLRRRRRPAQPARRPRLGMARRVPRARARPHRLGVQRHGGGRRAPLRQGSARRPVDPVRRPHVRRVGGRRARRSVRPGRRADRHGRRRPDRAALGRRARASSSCTTRRSASTRCATSSAGATTTRRTSRATWRGSRFPPGARRGTTTTTRFRAPTATGCGAGRSTRPRA